MFCVLSSCWEAKSCKKVLWCFHSSVIRFQVMTRRKYLKYIREMWGICCSRRFSQQLPMNISAPLWSILGKVISEIHPRLSQLIKSVFHLVSFDHWLGHINQGLLYTYESTAFLAPETREWWQKSDIIQMVCSKICWLQSIVQWLYAFLCDACHNGFKLAADVNHNAPSRGPFVFNLVSALLSSDFLLCLVPDNVFLLFVLFPEFLFSQCGS